MISIGRNSSAQKIVAVIIFLVVVAIATYLSYDNWKYRDGSGESVYLTLNIETEDVSNYHLKETSEGRLVVNDNVGLRFSVPDGWNVEMVEEDDEVGLLSQNLDVDEEKTFPLSGCIIGAGVTNFIKEFPDQELHPQIVQKQIRGESEIIGDGIQEIINIDGHPTLKTIQFVGHEDGRIVIVETPINDTLYHFGIMYALADELRCKDDFENFLNSITID